MGTLSQGYDTFAERKSFISIDGSRASLLDQHQKQGADIEDTTRASEVSIKKEKKPSKKVLLAISESDLHESSNLSNSQSRGSTMHFEGNINASDQAASIIEVDPKKQSGVEQPHQSQGQSDSEGFLFDTAEPIPEKTLIPDSLKVAPLAPHKNKKKQPSIYKKQAISPLNPPTVPKDKPLNKFQ